MAIRAVTFDIGGVLKHMANPAALQTRAALITLLGAT